MPMPSRTRDWWNPSQPTNHVRCGWLADARASSHLMGRGAYPLLAGTGVEADGPPPTLTNEQVNVLREVGFTAEQKAVMQVLGKELGKNLLSKYVGHPSPSLPPSLQRTTASGVGLWPWWLLLEIERAAVAACVLTYRALTSVCRVHVQLLPGHSAQKTSVSALCRIGCSPPVMVAAVSRGHKPSCNTSRDTHVVSYRI